MDDWTLLHRYVAEGSQDAFAALVARHVEWVFSVARRRVRDRQLAEDVVQAVFVALAQKAARLKEGTILSAWLFKVTRYAATVALRSELRRKAHEQEAAMISDASEPSGVAQWEQVLPLLDDQLERLRKADRQAVLLRFYERKNFAEVGLAMGISEEAARKRVARAVEMLRHRIAAKGVIIPAAALGGMLLTNATEAAGAHLVATATAAAMAAVRGGIVAASVLAITKGAMTMMAWSKAKVAIAVAVAALLMASPPLAVMIGRARAQAPANAEGPGLNTTVEGVNLNLRSNWAWQVRLSPDGKTMLFPRPIGGKVAVDPSDRTVTYELVLHEIASGREVILPTGTIPTGYETVFTRMNFFSPSGSTLVIPRFVPSSATGPAQNAVGTVAVGTAGNGPPAAPPQVIPPPFDMQLFLYDIATETVKETGIRGRQVMAKFDRTGTGLVVSQLERRSAAISLASLTDFKLKPLAISGYVQSLCPAADVAVVYVPPNLPGTRSYPASAPIVRPKARLVLYDLAADKEIRDLPVHERESQLDDLETQWTADGRYLYYVDLRDNPADPKNTISGARVWDRLADKEAGFIDWGLAVGPGPTATSMVLRHEVIDPTDNFVQGPTMEGFIQLRRRREARSDIILHDAASGRLATLVPSPALLEHAWGKRIVYATTSPEGKSLVRAMDIEIPPEMGGAGR